MRPGWNFQADIALRVETYGRRYIGETSPTATEIANGEFVDAMLRILSVTYGDLRQVDDFVDICRPYNDLSYNEIPPEAAQAIFNDFERLMDEYKKRSVE